MRKTLYCILIALAPIIAQAQDYAAQPTQQPLRFAWFSHSDVLRSMPEYTKALHSLDSLKAEYAKEVRRSTEDFTQKYEEFLDQQRTLAPSILRKRQAELQDLMSRNIAFKNETDRLMDEAGKKAFAPARRKLAATVAAIARNRGYAFVLNSDSDQLPYADPQQGDDITEFLKQTLSAGR